MTASLANQELQAAESMARALYPEMQSNWLRAVGCQHCQGTGYRGRQGIYEMIDVGPDMQELIMQQAPVEQMRRLAHGQGFRSMREDGLIKAWLGVTTVDEVHRVTSG